MNIKIRLFLVLILVFTFSSFAFADSADELDYHNSPATAMALADASSGDCVEVDSCGAAKVYINQIHGVNGTNVIGNATTSDTQLKASAGTVYAVMITTDGVTSGDRVQFDNTSDGDGCPILSFTFGNTDDVYEFMPSMGVAFSEGIYLDFVTVTGGEIDVNIVWQ